MTIIRDYNYFRSKILTKILTFSTARYTILCTCRLQPPSDDCAVRVQWFSSVDYVDASFLLFNWREACVKLELLPLMFFIEKKKMMSLGKPFQHHNVYEAGSVRGSVADPEGARGIARTLF